MKLRLEWSQPIALRDASGENLIYSFDSAKLPLSAGLYVFGRQHGTTFEALYVGKANSVRNRAKGQLKNLPLMLHLQKAKSGRRVVLGGRFVPKPKQNRDKCLPLLERALIRHFLSEAHDLVNIKGTRLKRHEITSAGLPKRIMPEMMFVDRIKGVGA
jgi:hypothetical protein